MKETEYLDFLKKAPSDHFSDEFIQFLRDNNEVVEETSDWLVIKNVKDPNDYTAFYKPNSIARNDYELFLMDLYRLKHYKDREWKIKAPHKRTVKLFHIHLTKKQ